MTVQDLITALQKVEHKGRIVVLAKDAEGNSYSPLAGLWTGAYEATSTWCGEVGLEELTDEDREEGYSDDDVCDGDPALILTPTN